MKDHKFLDANAFIGAESKPEPMTFHTKADLLAELDYYHIDEAVVTHTAARDHNEGYGNALLDDELEGEPRLHRCWVLPVHPDPDQEPIVQQVGAMVDAGVRMARVYPPHRVPLTVTPWLGYEVFGALEAHRAPVLLTDSDLGAWPDLGKQGYTAEMIYDLCKAFPGLPIIVVRFNYQLMRVIHPMLREFDNLYLEISNYTTHRGVELLVKDFGSERLIFGTGMPMQNPGAALALVRYAAISDAQKRDIAGDNLRRLMSEVR
jgi:hypothetical protein